MRQQHPIWWSRQSTPPPAPWLYAFEEFTNGETVQHWGEASAFLILEARRKTREWPTWGELFMDLFPSTCGLPSLLPDSIPPNKQYRARSEFRFHTLNAWRRAGWITWGKDNYRSLRPQRRR